MKCIKTITPAICLMFLISSIYSQQAPLPAINTTQPSGLNPPTQNVTASGQGPSFSNLPPIANATMPRNLPPVTSPVNTASISAITDTYFSKVKNILGWLPPFEQDIIAQCFANNTDTTRIIDPTCYTSSFSTVKSNSAQGIGGQLTDNSKGIRSSLGCLTKVTQNYAGTNETAGTTIQTQMSEIVSQQSTFNNCAAKFTKLMLETLVARRRFFLTTKDNIDATSTKDSNGNIDGFIFTSTEQSTIVTEFKNYATCLQTFGNYMSTSIIDVQTLIGTLGKCKPPQSSSAQPAGSQVFPSGQFANGTLPFNGSLPSNGTMPFPSGILPTNTTAPKQTTSTPMSGTQPATNGQLTAQASSFLGTLQTSLTNNKASGNIQLDKNGKPAQGLPSGIKDTVQKVISGATAKGTVDWTTFASKMTASTSDNSGFRSQPQLHFSILTRIANSKNIKQEFDRALKKESCTSDYLYYCTAGQCVCSDKACPTTIAGTTAITMQKSNVKIVQPPASMSNPGFSGTQGSQSPPFNGTLSFPIGNQSFSMGNQSFPIGSLSQPTSSQFKPTTSTVAPTGGQTMPTGGQTMPTGGQTMPTGGQTGPTGGQTMPTGGQTGPTGGQTMPTGGQTAPTAPKQTAGSAIPSNLLAGAQQAIQGVAGLMGSSAQTLQGALSSIPGAQGQTQSIPQNGSPDQAPNLSFSSQTNEIQNFYMCEGCLNGERFIYSEATFEITGQQLDFSSGNSPTIGQLIAQQANNCGKAFLSGSNTDKANCRGPLDDKCAADLDATCKNSGLYSVINSNPQTTSPYPDDCNETLSSYSESTCFSWIVKNLTKGTMIFDYKKFETLPKLISDSISSTSSTTKTLRNLQTNVVVGTDLTTKDSKAYAVVSQSTITDSDLTIDSATASTVPSASTYISDLNAVAANLTTNASILKVSLSMIAIVLIGLFF